MKVRDSGMPDEAMWAQFFDARGILTALDFSTTDADVVDFGCGYGTFTVAAATLASGTVYALDIDAEMIAATAAKAASFGLDNVRTATRDFVTEGTGLPNASADYAMLFNILHAEQPVELLREALRVLRPGGKAAVIHWIHDATTPRGPDLSIRPPPQQCRAWAQEAGFEVVRPTISLPPHHYGLLGRKPTDR
jgi:SAM-dependent methyltransferase